jgi:hypothetical protein
MWQAKAVELGFVLLVSARAAQAGCIGPVIMGECKGQDVPWDTHPPGEQHTEPPAGSQWDWRGTHEQRQHPNEINPFTGHDPQDSHWLRQNEEQDSHRRRENEEIDDE